MNKSILKTALAAGTLLLCANSAAAGKRYANVTGATNPAGAAQVYVTTTNYNDPSSINFSTSKMEAKGLYLGDTSSLYLDGTVYVYTKLTDDAYGSYEFVNVTRTGGDNDNWKIGSTEFYDNNRYTKTTVTVRGIGGWVLYPSYTFTANFQKITTDYSANIVLNAASTDPADQPDGVLSFYASLSDATPSDADFQPAGSSFPIAWSAKTGDTAKTVYLFAKVANPDYNFEGWNDAAGNRVSTSIEKVAVTINGKDANPDTYSWTAIFSPKTAHYYADVTLAGYPDNFANVFASLSADEPAAEAYKSAGSTFTLGWTATPGETSKTIYLFTAPTNADYAFSNWSDAANQQISTEMKGVAVTVNGNILSQKPSATFSANYQENQITVGYNSSEFNGVAPEIAKSKEYVVAGREITVSAKAPVISGLTDKEGNPVRNNHFVFRNWTDQNGNIISDQPEYTFTVSGKQDLTAHFDFVPTFKGAGYYRIKSSRQDYTEYLKAVGNVSLSSDNLLTDDYYMTADMVLAGYKAAENAAPYSEGNLVPFSESDPATIWWLDSDEYFDSEKYTDISKVESFGDFNHFKGILVQSGADLKSQNLTAENYMSNYGRHLWMSNGAYAGSIAMRGTAMTTKYIARFDGGEWYGGVAHNGGEDVRSSFEFEPIDVAHADQFYFGAKPDDNTYCFCGGYLSGIKMRYEEGFWTTMYTAFPYECIDGTKAFYIAKSADGTGFVVKPIETVSDNGNVVVPKETAVLLKCNSVDPKENRLIPLPMNASYAAPSDNLLRGDYQTNNDTRSGSDLEKAKSYHYTWLDRGNWHSNYKNSDYTQLTSDHYVHDLSPRSHDAVRPREAVASEASPIQFRRVTESRPLMANGVYLNASEVLAANPNVGDSFDVFNGGLNTGVEEIEAAEEAGDDAWYTLSGIRVDRPQRGQIYIHNHRKIRF